jgi:hypothetical protein
VDSWRNALSARCPSTSQAREQELQRELPTEQSNRMDSIEIANAESIEKFIQNYMPKKKYEPLFQVGRSFDGRAT